MRLRRAHRILWRLYGYSARLLKTKLFRTAASNTSFPEVWLLLVQYFERVPGFFWVVQRNSFFTMPEILENKADLELYSPHPEVRGMTTLDRAAFKRTIVVPVLKVRKEVINKLLKSLKHITLHRPGLKRVIDDPKDEDRLVLLDPYKISAEYSLEESEQEILKQFNIDPQVSKYNLELTYDNFKTEEILRAVLPVGQDVTSGFTRIGHIAHLNLRDHQLPYKHLIGQVIIDKNPGITCSVNKINIIDNTYRNFQMEVLAGEANMITKTRENNITYEFDFSKVYWNSRLSTEHGRIIELLKPGDVLFDVFAGVGPFAIPAAKKKCSVFANDLNPESYKWLLHNCKLNKVDKNIKNFNMDGRDFLLGPVKEELTKELSLLTKERKNTLHIVMNLPALAIEFLDVFKHLLDGKPCSTDLLPTVHCYSFSKHDSPAKDVQEWAEVFLGTSLEGRCSTHLVRSVAPNKEMMCISFQIPAEVLFKKQCTHEESPVEPASKRLRPNEDSPEEKLTSLKD
ncbi:tRNA (guanine(37)-N1)-methyltransferase isoform X2 [Trachemys scripta elegans]|uniref:tRNA (guanine(37)-N1)-methyltransferase isoform X2 n=2 Tax=Trachemys scripta elegans TaxID=31138 RepID=UPI00155405AF|nr:tRNA (guanine(37)-N1)-methyltransferase isoform X2 [Trachemys scripta elegans]